jgi:predicted O-linked N-acetylglucosamine transferase (SPINDLY family)
MTIPEAFQIAVEYQSAGRLAEAEAIYRRILAAQPNHAGALHFLGVIALQVGRHDAALELIRKSSAIDPKNPMVHSNLGVVCRATGRLDEAVAAYRRSVELQPDFAEVHNNLGNALWEQGELDEAIAACRRAIELQPDLLDAHVNLGDLFRDRGQLDDAIAAYRRALEIKPDFPEVCLNLGAALASLNRLDEAIGVYRRAIEIRPDYTEIHINLGAALAGLGRLDDAMAEYRRAIELNADYPEAHNNLGNALKESGELDAAIAAYRRAIVAQPDYPDAHSNLGNALKDRGELDEAMAAYRRALQIKPDDLEAHSNLVQALHYHPGHDAMAFAEEHRRWNRQFGDPLKQFARPRSNPAVAGRRLRIGYVSPDFRNHPVGRFALPLLEQHDRERFEIICYSGVTSSDSVTERFRGLAGKWRDTVGLSDARLDEMIREDGVDILVDLAMHTAGNRLLTFARQPAPVQVTWLAYPGSTGLPSIGYRLTDAHMDPPGEKQAWSAEEAVRLPDCWCCYDPVDDMPEINALPARSAAGVTFASLNNFAKVHEGVLALWARVMDAVRGSRLLMFCPEGRARERVSAFFGARGIGADRVEFAGFLPRWEYLSLYQRIDLALDPFPCNGMTTTCDALWMGVPVLTLPREMPASRAGLSLLSCVGLGELAASSEDGFVRIAVELAGNLPRLAEMRATLRARMRASPLMDAPRFARNLEAAFLWIWKRRTE